MAKVPVGKYRTPAVGSREAEVYVEDGAWKFRVQISLQG